MTGEQVEVVEEILDMHEPSIADAEFLHALIFEDTDLQGDELDRFIQIHERYLGYGFERQSIT